MPASATGNRPEELAERLAVGDAAAEGEALLKVLREVKNQIIGNKTKKLRFLHLGAVPRISSVLASSAGGGDAALIVQAAAAIGSFACGVEDGVRAVLDAGAVPHLIRILSHPDEKEEIESTKEMQKTLVSFMKKLERMREEDVTPQTQCGI